MLLRQGIERVIGGSSRMVKHSADLSWPKGIGLQERAHDLAWIIFFVGAIGLDPPWSLGRVEKFVWFPVDLAALIAFWLWPGLFLALMRRNALLLTWPLLAIMSAIWSVSPGVSLYHGLQLLMTVLVGVLLSLHASLFRVIQFYFVALTLAAVLSLFFAFASPSTAIAPTGEWVGLFRHKNMLGIAMALQTISGICLFLQGWQRGFTAAATILGAGILVQTRSGAAVVAWSVALLPLIPIFLYRRGHTVFVFSLGMLLSALAVGMLYIDIARIDVVQSVLDSLGKDASLTGRTILWDFGMQAFEERPWLGFGYHGWWEADETAAATLKMVMKQDLWMFHNNFLELAVAFGVWGPIALGAVVLFALMISLRAFVADPQYITAWPLLYLLLVLVQATAENPLFNNHGLAEVILVSICSVGMLRREWGGKAAHADQAGLRALPAGDANSDGERAAPGRT